MTQSLFEDDHPDIASTLNNLARLYDDQWKYSVAEPLFQDALAMRQRLFEGDHPQVASSLNNLAHLYYHQGKYNAAVPLFQKALAIRERMLGGDPLDTMTIRETLIILQHQRTPLFALKRWLTRLRQNLNSK
jgi:tetratricopeptide (TPR) repeat protein